MSDFMQISGVVCEYNPFHNGHLYHLQRTRAHGATHIVAVLSGSFVQRGEPAIFDKWTRTRSALQNGADLVLELPVSWAMAGAQRFARGAVFILHALGCVNELSFGSECGELSLLWRAAAAVNAVSKEALAPLLASGAPFAAARQQAVRALAGEQAAAVLAQPNNILAVEYLAALDLFGAQLTAFTVPRTGAGHDGGSPVNGVASASFLRRQIKGGASVCEYIPPNTAPLLAKALRAGRAPALLDRLERPIFAALRTMSSERLAHLPDTSEGLENRILSACRRASSLSELYALAKSKRYSHARIRRIVMGALLGLTQNAATPPYLRVLGLNDRGRQILRAAKATATLPIVTRPAEIAALGEPARETFALERAATDLWALAAPQILPAGLDFTEEAVYLPGV